MPDVRHGPKAHLGHRIGERFFYAPGAAPAEHIDKAPEPIHPAAPPRHDFTDFRSAPRSAAAGDDFASARTSSERV